MSLEARLAQLEGSPRRHLLALLLLLLCGALLWTSERGRTATADEPLHLIRGHAFWWKDTARLSYAHPPLANAITSLPHAKLGDAPWGPPRDPSGELESTPPKHDPQAPRAEVLPSLSGWEVANPLPLSSAYFRHDFSRAQAELTSARRVMMLWTLGLALFLYAWLERRYGWTAAIIGLGLFAVHPTLLAHGRLVTTDMPLTATALLSLAATIAWIERPSWTRVWLFALATTAMALSKHSGLAYTVVLSLIVLGAAALGRGGFAPDSDHPRARLRRSAVVGGQLALVALLMITAIAAIYRFDRVGLSVAELLAEPEPHNWISSKHDYELLERSPIAKLPPSLRLPFPYTWLVGLATVSKQNAMGHGNFFFGLRPRAGHPLYFPVMLFAKSPSGLLVLLGAGAGLVFARLRRREWPSLTTTVLVIFAAVTLASACGSRINIGVRHVLPLLLISIVFAARAAQLLLAGALARIGARGGRALVLSCALGCGLGAAWSFPAWLGDFNLLVGGPAGGHRISVIGEDWGQDVGDLGELALDRGWERVVYYTNFPLRREALEARGLEVQKLRCGDPYYGPDPVVVHLSEWIRQGSCFAWLRDRAPTHVVNHHILVFIE
ncbi:MAG: glycosyltransferase family 39 protein [Enhygromyxa sp.]